MTSLTTEAASFFSCNRGMKGQSGPKDVARSLFVGLRGVSTCSADEYRLSGAVFLSCMPAGFAADGGVAGVDHDADAPSVFRFGTQNRDELSPAGIDDASVEPRFGGAAVGQEWSLRLGAVHRFGAANHVCDGQVLQSDQVITPYDLQGSLMVVVAPSIGDLALPGSHYLAFASPVIGATHSTSKPSLRFREFVCCTARPPWVADVAAVGGDGEVCDPQIDTDLPSGGRQRVARDVVARKNQHPSAPLPADLDRFHPPEHLPVRGDLDLSNTSQIDALLIGMPAGSVTVFRPLHAVKSTGAFESRVSSLTSSFQSMEEEFKRLVEPTQCGLLTRIGPHRYIRANNTYLGQLCGLVFVRDPGSPLYPSIPTLLQGGVIQLAMGVQTRRQSDVLARCWAHSKFVSAPHTTASRRRSSLPLDQSLRVGHRYRWQRSYRSGGMNSPKHRRNRGTHMPEPYETPPTTFRLMPWPRESTLSDATARPREEF